MIIFKDKLSGEELFTDAYKTVEEKTYIKFTGKMTSRKEGIDDSLIGANASAEEQQEQTEDCAQCGLDFVMTAHLHEGALSSKKDFQKYFKDYFKNLQEKCIPSPSDGEDRGDYDSKVKEFKGRAKEFFDMVMENYKDMCCYFSENDYAGENSCCFVKWLDEKEVEVYVFKDGLDQEKC